MKKSIQRLIAIARKILKGIGGKWRRGDSNTRHDELPALLEREQRRSALEAKGWKFELPRAKRLVFKHKIATVIDCGANRGQFVSELRKAGWKGDAYSFEPVSDSFAALQDAAMIDENWHVFPFALGEKNETAEIRISGNSVSSSMLEFSKEFTEMLPEAGVIGTEKIQVKRLDDWIVENGLKIRKPVLLKLDVQGFEMSVLKGAQNTLKIVTILQTELALKPSYVGAPLFDEIKAFLNEKGFVLVHLVDGHADRLTHELHEMDGVFLQTVMTEE